MVAVGVGVGEELGQIADALSRVACLDVDTLSGSSALSLLSSVSRVESIACSLKLSLARRVELSNQHRSLGFSSASELVASSVGVTGSDARAVLATARQLEGLPLTRAQFSSGALSSSQVTEVARGASVDASVEKDLLELASRDSTEALRRERARLEKLPSLSLRRRSERFCDRPGAIGMTDFWGSLANEDFAVLKSSLDSRAKALFRAARTGGVHRPQSAYLAEALVGLARDAGSGARSGGSGSAVNLNVVVEHPVLVGDQVGSAEIPGVGPVSVETAKSWSEDCWLNVLVRKGRDITAVASERRHIPSDVKRALDIEEPVCGIRGCGITIGLERDHREELRDGGLTELSNLGWLCSHHHKLKTHRGYRLDGDPGNYTLIPPKSARTPKGSAQEKLFPPGTG